MKNILEFGKKEVYNIIQTRVKRGVESEFGFGNISDLLKLRPYSFETVGIDSANDLTKSKLGEYGETQNGWTADEAKGFIKVSSTPLRVYYGLHPDEKR